MFNHLPFNCVIVYFEFKVLYDSICRKLDPIHIFVLGFLPDPVIFENDHSDSDYYQCDAQQYQKFRIIVIESNYASPMKNQHTVNKHM